MGELTPQQESLLFKLATYQLRQKGTIVFTVSGGYDVDVTRWGEEVKIIEAMPREIIWLWADDAYITLSQRSVGGYGVDVSTLILRQQALDYYHWQQKWPITRKLIEIGRSLVQDARTVAVAIIITIATTYVLKWLGLP